MREDLSVAGGKKTTAVMLRLTEEHLALLDAEVARLQAETPVAQITRCDVLRFALLELVHGRKD